MCALKQNKERSKTLWLFCKSGYFSAVKHNAKPETILLRARVKGDLERLAKAHRIDMKIRRTPAADYAFRAELPAAEWTRAVMEESDAIDYGNFKNAVHDGTARDDAYLDVWSVMYRLQDVNLY